jgi:hypothetical protein
MITKAEAGKGDPGSGGAKNRTGSFDWRREEGRPHGGIRPQIQVGDHSIPSCLPEDRRRLGVGDGWSLVDEGIIKSLDEPDSSIDAIWAGEAEKRLRAYRAGELEGIPMEEIFKEE